MNTKAKKFQEIVDNLNLLNTADEIAKHLMDNGIRGLPMDHLLCPISNYIRSELRKLQETVSDLSISTDNYMVSLRDAGSGMNGYFSPSVVRFIKRFDRLHYQDLVDWDLESRSGV